MNDVHGVELSPSDSHTMYVTSRNTSDASNNMELVIDITSLSAPVVKGSVNGLATSACGVYAIADKSAYYGTKPSLSISKTNVYWNSYADYTARKLSVDYSIGNGGSAAASDVTIVGSSSTAGVSSASALPMSAGDIAGGGSTAITLAYNVPSGSGSYMTTTYATAQNGSQVYAYPGPYPGS